MPFFIKIFLLAFYAFASWFPTALLLEGSSAILLVLSHSLRFATLVAYVPGLREFRVDAIHIKYNCPIGPSFFDGWTVFVLC